MVATPAWPPSSLPRLFVDQPLSQDLSVELDGNPAHYLAGVLRLQAGDELKVFDDRTGEWLARITEAGRRKVRIEVLQSLRPRETVPDLWLVFAPIKRGRIDWLVEKATELGADRLVPVITRRTIVDRVNLERLRAHMIEAAEQCERNALPQLEAPARLDALLRDWPAGRRLYFADESGGTPLAAAISTGPAAILIGPEGGFTPEEREAVRALPQTVAVALGPRILRADTAALAALALFMGMSGDWADGPHGRSQRG